MTTTKRSARSTRKRVDYSYSNADLHSALEVRGSDVTESEHEKVSEDPKNPADNGDEGHPFIDDEEEALYTNLDDLRDLIDDHSEEERVHQQRNDEEPGNDSQNDEEDDIDMDSDAANEALLAEFSDFEGSSDEDEGDFMDAIREANNFKVKKKNRRGKNKFKREKPVDPEVAQLLSEANEAFVKNDLPTAERLFNKIIKKDPRNFAAYETLGDIYQLQGRMNDCCNSWFLAAHINSSDWEFWKIVAVLSFDLEHYRQAIYCFSRVINLNNEEWESIYRRALLYKKMGQIRKALNGFQKLYENNPYDANILRELAILNVDYNRVPEAIKLYMDVYESNVKRRQAVVDASENALVSSDDEDDGTDSEDDADETANDVMTDEMYQEEKKLYPGVNWKKFNKKHRCIPFDWSSLNIVAELFLKIPGKTNENIKKIKTCARWIQHRELQTFWDDSIDDSEFDNRRLKNSRYDSLPDEEKAKEYILPIDIRVRLGLLRLDTESFVEALNHFQFLYDENFGDVADLNYEVGVALTKAEKFQEALDFLTPLLSLPDYGTLEFYENIAKCYKETEDYETARQFLERVIEMDPESLEQRLSLAEVHYHLGNIDTFRSILNEVTVIRKRQKAELYGIIDEKDKGQPEKEHSEKTASENEENREGKDISNKPLLEDSKYKKYSFKKKKTPQDIERERAEREKKITLKVMDKYESLKNYSKDLEGNDQSQINQWIRTVSDLVDVFSSVKNFFVRSRSKKFVGIIRKTKKFHTVVDYQLERLSRLSEGDQLSDSLPVMEERVTLTSTRELRGLSYDQWFDLFMDLALTITKYRSVQDGMSVIDTAQEVNVFIQDPKRAKIMKFVRLAIVLQLDNEEELLANLRLLLNQYQFSRKILLLFMYSLSNGKMSSNILTSTIQQKFFLRLIKAFDAVRYDTHVRGQASITNDVVDNPQATPSPYIYYIYSVLLYSSRGFLSSLQYLSQLETEIPDDPTVNLLLGLAHMQRSMQRLTAARHFQILHGLRYLYRYYDIRKSLYTTVEKQEADYNIGRAFHLIGLVTVALKYYNRVLDNYEDDKLKKHAAFNCINIYQESGNSALANSLMEKYLTI
ncbi:transcription factor tau 131 kDa subunit [Monosporozyma unispora]